MYSKTITVKCLVCGSEIAELSFSSIYLEVQRDGVKSLERTARTLRSRHTKSAHPDQKESVLAD